MLLSRHLAISADMFGYYNWEEGDRFAIGFQWVEAGDAAKHFKLHGTASYNQNYWAPNASAKFEKFCSTCFESSKFVHICFMTQNMIILVNVQGTHEKKKCILLIYGGMLYKCQLGQLGR